MKKILMSALVCVIAFAVASCAGGNTPSAVATKAMECAMQKDYKGLVDLFDIPEEKAAEKEQLVQLFEQKGSSAPKVESFKVLDETIDGDKAVVKMEVTDKDGKTDTSDMKLVKNDKGEWKLDMSK
ncbi:MAG: DUF4878 domain-containing protein [Prevotella sp.]|nr:DUF4878 domain-containing protein [Prevotella sp.]